MRRGNEVGMFTEELVDGTTGISRDTIHDFERGSFNRILSGYINI